MDEKSKRRMIIASRIRQAREMAGLSQGQVARMLGLHRPSISEAEAGNRNVSAEELAELAKIYDVSISWLAGENAERPDPRSERAELAARQLSRLSPEDLDRLLTLLASIREQEQ